MRTFHPRMAWIHRTHQQTVGGGAGWVRGGVRGMDAAAKPRDGLTASPRTQPAPPNLQPSCCRCRCSGFKAGAGPQALQCKTSPQAAVPEAVAEIDHETDEGPDAHQHPVVHRHRRQQRRSSARRAADQRPSACGKGAAGPVGCGAGSARRRRPPRTQSACPSRSARRECPAGTAPPAARCRCR